MKESQYQIRTTHSGHVLEVIFVGSITLDIWFRSFDEMINHNDGRSFREARYNIIDYTDGTLEQINSQEIIDTSVDFAHQAYVLNPDIILVNIVPRDLEYGLSRMFEAYAFEVKWEIHTIRSRSELEGLIKV